MPYKRDDIFIIDVYILVIAIDHRPKKNIQGFAVPSK